MSIINDALKKTQSSLQQQVSSEQEPKRKPNSFPVKPVIAALITLIFCGLIMVMYFKTMPLGPGSNISEVVSILSDQGARNSQEKTTPIAPTSETIEPIKGVEEATKTSQSSMSSIDSPMVLNGTMTMGGEQFALINNEIYKKGDRISGRQIIHIDSEKIKITENGKILTLRVKK